MPGQQSPEVTRFCDSKPDCAVAAMGQTLWSLTGSRMTCRLIATPTGIDADAANFAEQSGDNVELPRFRGQRDQI